jgi:hypothetical protein
MVDTMIQKHERLYYRTEIAPILGVIGPFLDRNVGESLTADPWKPLAFQDIEESLSKNFCGPA